MVVTTLPEDGLRGRVAWATFSDGDYKGPRPVIVLIDQGTRLCVFKGTSTLRDASTELRVDPKTRLASAWRTSSKPLSNVTAFAPVRLWIDRSAICEPIGGLLHPRPFRELELLSSPP